MKSRVLSLCLAIILLLVLFSCDSGIDDKEEESSVSVTWSVTLGDATYYLNEDLSELRPDTGSALYNVEDLYVTIMDIQYYLEEVYDSDGNLTGYNAVRVTESVYTYPSEVEYIFTGPLGDLVLVRSTSDTYSLDGYTLDSTSSPSTATDDDGIRYSLTIDESDSTYSVKRQFTGLLGVLEMEGSTDTQGNNVEVYTLSGYSVDFPDAVSDNTGMLYSLSIMDVSAYDYFVDYAADLLSEDLGTVTVENGETATIEDEDESYTLENRAFTYLMEYGNTTTAYTVTLSSSANTYSTAETETLAYTGVLGDITVTTNDGTVTAVLNGYSFEIDSSIFEYVLEEGNVTTTYQITLSSSTYSASVIEIVTTYSGTEFGTITVTESFGSSVVTVETDDRTYTAVFSDSSTLVLTATGTSSETVYEIYLDDESYTYTTSEDESVETYTGSFGTLTVTTKGSDVTADLEGTVIYSLEDNEDAFEYVLESGNVATTYILYISSSTAYSYYIDYYVTTYYADTFGTITAVTEDGVTTVTDPDGNEVTLSGDSFEYVAESGSTTVTYTITLSGDSYTYTKDKEVTVISGDVGDITVTTDYESGTITASIGSASYTVEESEFEYEESDGSVVTTYTIALSASSYSATVTKIVTTYSGTLGTFAVVEEYGKTTVTINGVVYTVDAVEYSFTYTAGDDEYTIILDTESLTYTFEGSSVEYEAADGYESIGTITVTSGTAVVGDDYSASASVEDNAFTYIKTDGSVSASYTITLVDDDENLIYTYTYTVSQTVTTYSSEGSLDDVIKTEKDGGTEYTLSGNTVTDGAVTVDGTEYTITLDEDAYTYSYSAVYTGDIGEITVTNGTVAELDGESSTVSGESFTLSVTSGNTVTTYTITLNDGNTYTATVSKTVSTYTGALGTATVTDGTTAAIGTKSNLEVSDGVFTYTYSGTEYTIILADSTYSYTYNKTYTGTLGTLTVTHLVDADGNAGVYSCAFDTGSASYSDGTYTATVDGTEYTLTLGTSKYNYSAEYTPSSSSEDLGTITVTDGSQGYIELYSASQTFSSGTCTYTYSDSDSGTSITYSVTLNTGNTYTAEITSSYITYQGYFGKIVVTDGATAKFEGSSTSYTLSDGVLTYTAGYTFTITFLDDYTYTSVRTVVFEAVTGAVSLGDITKTYTYTYVNGTSVETITYLVGSTSVSDLSSANIGGVTYVITANTTNYDYNYTATYTAASGAYAYGTVVVTNGVSATCSSTAYTVSDNSFTGPAVISGNITYTYLVKMSTTANTYSTSLTKTVTTYTGTYGTITKTVSGSTTSYSLAANSTYGTPVLYTSDSYSSSGVSIYIGYVRFEVVFSSTTYTATTVCWVDELICGYGEYKVYISALKVYYFLYYLDDRIAVYAYLDPDLYGDEDGGFSDNDVVVDETGTIVDISDGDMTMTFRTKTAGTILINYGDWDDVSANFSGGTNGELNLSGSWYVSAVSTNYYSESESSKWYVPYDYVGMEDDDIPESVLGSL